MKIDELVEGVEYDRGDGKKYKVENGYFLSNCSIEGWQELNASYYEFSNMRFTECGFEPKIGESFYFPDFCKPMGFSVGRWTNLETDIRIKKLFGVYRTTGQAIQKARELGWVE